MAMGNSNLEPDQAQKAWDELVQSCPLLFRGEDSYWFECGPGWHDLLEELCFKIEAKLAAMPHDELHYMDSDEKPTRLYYVEQIKEKFATLRFYMDQEPDGVDNLIAAAEAKSSQTCETCGDPGEPRSMGWHKTCCDKHYQGYLQEQKERRERNAKARAEREAAKTNEPSEE